MKCIERLLIYENIYRIYFHNECSFFPLSFRHIIKSEFIMLGNLLAKKDKGASKKRSSHPSRSCKGLSLHLAVSTRVCSKNCIIACHAHALSIGPQRRRISIVVHFRPAVIAWLPVIVYCTPNHYSGICRICEHTSITLSQPYLYSESCILSLFCASFRASFRACVSAHCIVFVPNMEIRNLGLYRMVKAYLTGAT